jgi:hypothetical protein
MCPHRWPNVTLLATAALALTTQVARADGPKDTEVAPVTRDAKSEAPIVAYAYTAHGASASSVGAQAYGLGLAAPGQKGLVGGGVTAWGSPIDRLTLVADGSRDVFGNFAPSAAAIVRLLGRAGSGWSLGALGKFKVDGFDTGPGGETEAEMEGGILLSYAGHDWHFDLNAITGFGLGDDGEIDSEGRVRFGYDLGSLVRLGMDGQARYRLSGDKRLPGNRNGDFALGPQVLVGSSHFFGAFTAGPATMGVVNKDVGWTAVVSLGGTTL